MFLPHFHNHRTKDFFFGENRPVRIVGPDAGNVLGGAWDKMKRDGASAKEKYGVFKTWLRKPFYAQSTLGYLIKSPFILTRKAYEGVMAFNAKSTAAARAVGGQIGERLKDPMWFTIDKTRDITRETLKAGWQLTGAPIYEAGRANFYEFPKRAFVDQFRSFFKGLFNTTGAFLGRSKEAIIKTAIYPFSIINGTRKAITNVLWDAPKNLFTGNFKEAGKSAFVDPTVNMVKGIGGAPLAIAQVPYQTTMEAGVMATETAVNAGRAMAAPFEGIVNGYGAMSKAGKFIDYFKEKTADKFRDRYKNIFSNANPFSRLSAVAA